MRKRSTWPSNKSETPRQAASNRFADLYTMNQDHPQPSAVEYENGSPDSWAETPTDSKSVDQEYDGDSVKRNEIGLGEFRDDTWKHKDSQKWNGPGRYDNASARQAAERKASIAEHIARSLLRTTDEKLVADTAVDLMALPIGNLLSTAKRMSSVSTSSLSESALYKRSFACAKLAALMCGDNEVYVTKLGSQFMKLDDTSLKAILSIVSAAHKAAEEADESEESDDSKQTSAEEADESEEPEAKTSAEEADESEESDDSKQTSAEEQQASLSPEEMAMLQGMLQEESCEPHGDALSDLFSPIQGEAAPAAPVQLMASGNRALDISFDDDDDVSFSNGHTASLDELFSDDPEIKAQRDIVAASRTASQNVGRVASKGAKKLGTVVPDRKVTIDDQLSSIWSRPND